MMLRGYKRVGGRDWKGEKEDRMTFRGRIHVHKIVVKGGKGGMKRVNS